VANKKDQQAVISTEQGMKIAEELKTDFIEVSTSKFENIDDIFSKALNHAL
jgi:translation initiation factor IF-3